MHLFRLLMHNSLQHLCILSIVVQTLENEIKLHHERSKQGGANRQKKEMKLEDEAELRALGYME